MLYHPWLDTFLTVAKEGSFTKAAETLFISHTAVIKQINQLENLLKVKLFERSHQGVILTNAGQILLQESKKLIVSSEEIVEKVQHSDVQDKISLKIGTSMLYPAHYFLDLWEQVANQFPQFQIQLVTFDNNKDFFNQIGKDFDIVIGAYNAITKPSNQLFLPIDSYKFTISVPRTHPLASQEMISLQDLEGDSLMMLKKGISPINDAIRSDIQTFYPGITLIDIKESYDISTYNDCITRNTPLLSLECWDKIHPEIKSLPLKEHYKLPYGIIYAKSSSFKLKSFIETIKQTIG